MMFKLENLGSDYAEETPKTIFRKLPTPLNLCDMPTEMLEKIIGYINISDQKPIRATCRRTKDVSDTLVMQEYKKLLRQHISEHPYSQLNVALRLMEQGTNIFRRAGFESIFCDCILPLFDRSFLYFNYYLESMPILMHFYEMVVDSIGGETSPRWRLLYAIAVARLTKGLSGSKTYTSLLQGRVEIKTRIPWWLAYLLNPNLNLNNWRNISAIFFHMYRDIMYDEYRHPGHRVWLSKRASIITVYGSKNVCDLFYSCVEDEFADFQWPDEQCTVEMWWEVTPHLQEY